MIGKRNLTLLAVTVLCLSAVGFGCDFGGEDPTDINTGDDVSVGDDTAGADTNVADNAVTDTSSADNPVTPITVTAETCKEVLLPTEMNATLSSQLGAGGGWVWLASVTETGTYDPETSTQFYAVCAEVYRCENCGQWGQLEFMIFKKEEAPGWLNGVRGATTQLTGVGDEAWEYPLQTGVVFWKGDYAFSIGVRSGFVLSWTQAEINAMAAIVANHL